MSSPGNILHLQMFCVVLNATNICEFAICTTLLEDSLNCGVLCNNLFNIFRSKFQEFPIVNNEMCRLSYTQQIVDLPDGFLSSIKQSQIPIEKLISLHLILTTHDSAHIFDKIKQNIYRLSKSRTKERN